MSKKNTNVSNNDTSSWKSYIQACQKLGFKKATIINKSNFKVVATTSDADVATSYMGKDGNKINENQELLNDWENIKKFNFYGKQFKVIITDEADGKYVVAKYQDSNTKKTELICAYQFVTIWFIVCGPIKANDDDNVAKIKGIINL